MKHNYEIELTNTEYGIYVKVNKGSMIVGDDTCETSSHTIALATAVDIINSFEAYEYKKEIKNARND